MAGATSGIYCQKLNKCAYLRLAVSCYVVIKVLNSSLNYKSKYISIISNMSSLSIECNKFTFMVSDLKKPYKWLTESLRERMRDRKIRQSEIAINLDASQPTISLYLRNPEKLMAQDKDFVVNFIKEHGFKQTEAQDLARKLFAQDFKEIFGDIKPVPIPPTITKGELVSIRDLGTIQGGLKGLSFSNDDYEFVNVHHDDINGYKPEDCFRVTVTGDSMVSEDVCQKISPGSKAIFHVINSRMQPKENDVVAVWLEVEDIGIIKSYHKTPDYVILNSFNKRHRPIILDERNQGIIQGVLISVTHMFRQ
jgi:hypothetical protein